MSFRASRVPKRGTITLVVVLCVFGLVIHSRGSSRSALEASNEARRSLEWATTDDTSTVPELHYHDHDHSSDEIDNLIAHPPPRSSQPQPINPPSPSSMNGYLQLTPRSSFPTTNILLPVAGYTMFDRLFLKGGTLYVVVDDPRDPNIPQLKRMTSTAIVPTANNLVERIPTDKEMRVINVDEAQKILGESAIVIDGFSIYLNDPGGIFMNHYYHYWAELIFGAWKAYTTLDPNITRKGHTILPPPRRIVYPHADEPDWRDGPGLNALLTKAAFPSTALEYRRDSEDREDSGLTYVFERVVLVDRAAGSYGMKCNGPLKFTFKMNGDIMGEPSSPNWYQPVRQSVLRAFGVPDVPPKRPVVTYISRQGGRRSLRDEDHDALVAGLTAAGEKNNWEIVVARMQYMSKKEQVILSARTTVMIGVHGNGLSHQVWMDPTPFSAVFEIVVEGGWSYDFALPAEALGFRHYGVSGDVVNDSVLNYPKVGFPPNFHGRNLTASTPAILKVLTKRLAGWHA
ncbi:hypothetical protein BDY24DRAFT_383652 [Mrakia frigida]|uniref:uncharacterized protein n=1 Tax=Mrakia frigida TaxID=29902 RepID=UPI003FCBF6DD